MRKNNAIITYTASFFIPLFVMLFAYISNGILVQHSILLNDLFTQYINFLSYFRNSVLENGIFYSFSKGIGGNFFGIYSYYLASPLNLLFFLFDGSVLEYAVAALILLRFCLSSLAFCYFLRQQKLSQKPLPIILFSVLYALSSYMVLLSYHILWADAYILLPILIVMLQRLLKGEGITGFVAVFTLSIFSSYYMAYMMGLFCALFFIREIIIVRDVKTAKHQLIQLAKSAIISLGITSILLIPTFFSLLQGKVTDSYVSSSNLRAFNIFAIIPKLFVGGYDSVGNVSAPFVYCGACTGILAVGIIFLKNLSSNEKLADIFTVSALFFSLWWLPLYKAWHMFSLTNAFPFRFSYIFMFFICFLAYKTTIFFSELNIKQFVIFAAVTIVATAALGVWFPVHIRNSKILYFAVAAASILILLYLEGKRKNSPAMLIVAAIMLFDISINAYLLTGENYNALGYIPNGAWTEEYNATKEQLNIAIKDSFYRASFGSISRNGANYAINNSLKHSYNGATASFVAVSEQEQNKALGKLSSENIELVNAFLSFPKTFSPNDTTYIFPLLYKSSSKEPAKNEQNLIDYLQQVSGVQLSNDGTILQEADLLPLYQKMQTLAVQNLYQKASRIKGDITSDFEGQQICSSVVYDEAFTVKVNGEKVKTFRAYGSFLSFNLPKGDCKIEIYYVPKGLLVGAFISTITAFVTALLYFVKKRNKFILTDAS